MNNSQNKILGNNVPIKFPLLSHQPIVGMIDTGATTSSLHATNIQQKGDSVTFQCPQLSDNLITLDLYGQQEVVSADAGSNNRPMIKVDIEINNSPLTGVIFNLNDRSDMENPVLIGQNILKLGDFLIDVNKDNDSTDDVTESIVLEKEDNTRNDSIMEAIKILKKHNVTVFELVEFLRTAPLYLRNGDSNDK